MKKRSLRRNSTHPCLELVSPFSHQAGRGHGEAHHAAADHGAQEHAQLGRHGRHVLHQPALQVGGKDKEGTPFLFQLS